MRIVYVLNECPLPADSGPKIYALSILRMLLLSGSQVDLIVYYRSSSERMLYENMASEFDLTILGGIRVEQDVFWFVRRVLYGWTFRLMKSADYSADRFDEILGSATLDDVRIMIFDHCRLSHLRMPSKYGCVRILMGHDCYSNSYRKMLQFDCSVAEKLHVLLKYLAYRRIEAFDYKHYDRLWVVGAEDRHTLATRTGMPVKRITIPVDQAYFDCAINHRMQTTTSLRCVVGTAMSICDFARDISLWLSSDLPHEILSQFEFVGCGPKPMAALEPLLNSIGYRHYGWVSDYAEFMQTATVFIYPQRAGSGIQNKVIQAMAVGLVCILSEEVAHATGVVDGRECLVVNKPRRVWSALARLASDLDLLQKLSFNARRFSNTHYSYESVLSVLKNELSEATQ